LGPGHAVPFPVPRCLHRILSRALKIAERHGRISRNVATLVDAPAVAPNEIEPLTREEARRILDVAANKRNGARWSVALSLGIRQGEALGLRWSYVDLETGVIRAWFQVQGLVWRHGCGDPHACGEQWHRPACKKGCRQHRHRAACEPGCIRKGHVCYKRPCPADCMAHADKCPKRSGGGVVFFGNARARANSPSSARPLSSNFSRSTIRGRPPNG